MQLRPYQESSHSFLDSWWSKSKKHAILSLPCGAGKTFTASSWAVNLSKSGVQIFWAVHREELKKQAIKAFTALGVTPTVWDANNKPSSWSDVNVIMIQSARQLEKETKGRHALLIVDEAHHKNAPTWSSLIDRLNCRNILYLTATESEIVDENVVVHKEHYQELAEQGFLAKPTYERVLTKVECSLHTRGGDFTYKSLNKLNSNQRNRIVCERWDEHKDRYGKTLVFVATVKHAKELHKRLSKLVKNAYIITGDSKDREEILEEFDALPPNEPSILVSVDVFVEGTDVPSIQTIFICRPTLSSVLYVQMIGRGSRICEGKNAYYIVDFVDAVKRYEIRSAEILHEAIGDSVLDQRAKDLLTRDEKKEFIKKKLGKTAIGMKISPEQVDDLIGVAFWSNRYCKKKTVPVYSEDIEIITAAYNYYHSAVHHDEDLKKAINITWSEIGVECSLTYKQWKEMSWSAIGLFLNQKQAKFKIEFIASYGTPKKSEFRDYTALAEDAKEFNQELNDTFQGKEQEVWNEAMRSIPDLPLAKAIHKHIKPVKYESRIMTIEAPRSLVTAKKPSSRLTPCLANIRNWKKQIIQGLSDATDDDKIEIAFHFRNS